MPCATTVSVRGVFWGTTQGRDAMSRRALDQSGYWCYIVQAVAVGNLRCSSSYEAPGSPSAQPVHPGYLRPVSPSRTT